jgi:hypothetical protein
VHSLPFILYTDICTFYNCMPYTHHCDWLLITQKLVLLLSLFPYMSATYLCTSTCLQHICGPVHVCNISVYQYMFATYLCASTCLQNIYVPVHVCNISVDQHMSAPYLCTSTCLQHIYSMYQYMWQHVCVPVNVCSPCQSRQPRPYLIKRGGGGKQSNYPLRLLS